MLPIDQLRTMYADALADCTWLVGRVVDLSRPTPCEGWDVSALLGHMIGQNTGFAAAVRDGDADVAAFAPAPVELGTLVAVWASSVDRLREAFEAAPPADSPQPRSRARTAAWSRAGRGTPRCA